MENENKVVLSLEKYGELIDKSKEYEIKLKEICNLLLSCTELDCSNEKLDIQLFNIEYSRLMDLIREIFPKEYKIRLDKLKKEEYEKLESEEINEKYNPHNHPVREFIGTIIAVIICLPIFLIIFIFNKVVN